MTINVYDLTSQARVREKNIIELLIHAARSEKMNLASVNVVIAGDGYLQDLNRRFLNKDQPTNVMAFAMEEVSEIYISFDQCQTDSDIYYYAIHGFLHLAGHDHTNEVDEKVMHELCCKYITAVLHDDTV